MRDSTLHKVTAMLRVLAPAAGDQLRFDQLKRREFITLLGGAAAAWPLAARAQQQPVPLIGFIQAGSAEVFAPAAAAFRNGLRETGYVEDQNVAVDYHWLEGRYNQVNG